MMSFPNHLRIACGLGLGLLLGLATSSAHAQASSAGSRTTFDLAGGFTAIRANEGPGQCGCFYMLGGNGELAINNGGHLAFITNAGYTSKKDTNGVGRDLALLTVLEGGRYTLNPGGKLSPYGQASVGIVHTFSNYAIDESTTRVALAAGAGVDLRVSARFSVRPAQVEYLLTTVSNGQNNFQNQLRMSAGVVFHLTR